MVLISEVMNSQNILVIDKPGKVRRVRFYPGSEIKFKMKDGNERYEGVMEFINSEDQSFVLRNGQKVYLSQIETIYGKETRFWVVKGAEFFYKGALILFGFTTFNRAINNDKPVVNKDFALAAGGSVVVGTAFLPFVRKKFKSKKFRYRVLNLSPE